MLRNITFECDELDDKNWCADFGGLKELKKTLEYTFDHKLVVAGDDPHLDLLKMLDETGVAQIIVLEGGVGCERFAEFVLKTADTFIDEDTNGRVRVKSVQINEHEKNFATAHRVEDTLEVTITQSNSEPVDIDAIEAAEARINVIGKNGNDGEHYEKEGLEDVHGPIATKASLQPPVQKPSTKTKGGWFDGTTWG